MKHIFRLPTQLIGASIVLLIGAAFLSENAFVTGWTISLWLVFASGIYHLVIWLNRKRTTAGELRAVEFIYVFIGLIGVLRVMEVQSSLLKGKVNEVLRRYGSNDVPNAACQNYEVTKEFKARVECNIEEEYNAVFSNYDHTRVKWFLKSYDRDLPVSVDTRLVLT